MKASGAPVFSPFSFQGTQPSTTHLSKGTHFGSSYLSRVPTPHAGSRPNSPLPQFTPTPTAQPVLQPFKLPPTSPTSITSSNPISMNATLCSLTHYKPEEIMRGILLFFAS